MPSGYRPVDLAHPPAGMREPHAAAYIGLSISKLRSMENPPPHRWVGGVKVYARRDLDAWIDSLPTAEEAAQDEAEASCNAVFG